MGAEKSLYAKATEWLDEDWARMEKTLGDRVQAFAGKRVLVTGAAGFLGFGFLHFLAYLNRSALKAAPLSFLAADNFIRGCPRWLVELRRYAARFAAAGKLQFRSGRA